MAKKIVAGLVIFRQSDQGPEYLMLEPRNSRKDWSPPKGRVIEGSDEFLNALTHTQKEVGYNADDLEIYRNHHKTVSQPRKKNKGENKSVTFWLAKLRSLDKNPVLEREQHSRYHWMKKDEAASRYGSDGLFADMFTQFDDIINNDALV